MKYPTSEFGRALRTWRVEHDLTQTALAKLIGISHSEISLFETTDRRPTVKMQQRMSEAMGVNVSEWVARDTSRRLEKTLGQQSASVIDLQTPVGTLRYAVTMTLLENERAEQLKEEA